MNPRTRRRLHRLENGLALALLAAYLFFWSRSGRWFALVRSDLELLATLVAFAEFALPALLGLVVLVGAIFDGLRIGSVVLASLALVTIFVAGMSYSVLLFPPEGGGVFFGGIFTMVAGFVLALAVVVRTLVGSAIRYRAAEMG